MPGNAYVVSRAPGKTYESWRAALKNAIITTIDKNYPVIADFHIDSSSTYLHSDYNGTNVYHYLGVIGYDDRPQIVPAEVYIVDSWGPIGDRVYWTSLDQLTRATDEYGIIWVETDINSSLNSIYLKYYDSNEKILIDSGVNEIVPYIDIEKNILVYYIADKNLQINYINLLNLKKENIKTHNNDYLKEVMSISQPKTDGNNIIWSEITSLGANMYVYSIKNKSLETINLDSNIYSPIIYGGTIIAIKENNYFDNELNIQYASDYIVKYNRENKLWESFESKRIEKYIGYPRECVTNIVFDSNIFYWSSTLTTGNTLYDLKSSKFISLTTKKLKYKTNILSIKNNNIYYELINDDEVIRIIYKYKGD